MTRGTRPVSCHRWGTLPTLSPSPTHLSQSPESPSHLPLTHLSITTPVPVTHVPFYTCTPVYLSQSYQCSVRTCLCQSHTPVLHLIPILSLSTSSSQFPSISRVPIPIHTYPASYTYTVSTSSSHFLFLGYLFLFYNSPVYHTHPQSIPVCFFSQF